MRIYYIGQLWQGGTCRERMHALQAKGHEIFPFDTTPWVSAGPRLFRTLAHRLNTGPSVAGLNRALAVHCRSLGEMELVWIDKGRWIYPETLALLRRLTRGRLLHYTPDAQLLQNRSRHFERSIPEYDWIVTTKPFEVDRYKVLGAKELIFVLQGYDQRFADYRPEAVATPSWASDVCFIGHHEDHYAARLKAVSETGVQLRIWGPGWSRYARWHRWARRHVYGDGVWGDDYLHALANARIALGLLSKWIPETTTTRSFEIPAVGTFLLAERTPDHQALFEEGQEAEFFSDDSELQRKIGFYLKHEQARERIAAAGRQRCQESGYSSSDQLAGILERLRQAGVGAG